MRIDYSQMKFYHPKLRQLLKWLESYYGIEFTETSQLRLTGGGVHTTLPLRGIDLRCYQESIGKVIARDVNKHWKYGPSRPRLKCCIFHDTGGGKHLHLQVSSETKRV